MAYKRQIDRLPIIPADAREQTVVCHFCIVGCDYKAYSWEINKQGGSAPEQNAFGVDLSQQQPPETAAWYAPAMYNIVKQDGKDVHLVIKPDVEREVNSGLGSIRGARLAEESYSRATSSQMQRLTDPLVSRYGQMQPTSARRRRGPALQSPLAWPDPSVASSGARKPVGRRRTRRLRGTKKGG